MMDATIIQTLPAISFTENLPDIIVSEVTEIAYLSVLISGESIVADIPLTPDANSRITIFARQMVQNIPGFAVPSTIWTLLPQITIILKIGSQVLTQTCRLIPGRIRVKSPDIEEFLARNFLTWQPQAIETTPDQPQYIALIKSDRYIITEIHSVLITATGAKYTKVIDSTASPLMYMQLDTSFKTLWLDFCEKNGLVPVSYDVYGKSYLSSNPTPETRPFAQRYKLRTPRYNDTCFGFQNTLGGFDTFLLEGKQIYQPEGSVTTFKTYSTEKELINDYTSIWEVNTGRLETEGEANQVLDFFKSTNRYIHQQGVWLRIIITEYKVKSYKGEANCYSFKYHLADKNESRYYERAELPEARLPTDF